MATVDKEDIFNHNSFSVPGGGPYTNVTGTPVRDTVSPPPGEPAYVKLSAAANEFIEYQHSNPQSRGQVGFYFRVNTGEEPAGNTVFCQLWTAGFGQAAKLYWIPSTNEISFTVADIAFTNFACSLDAWHWIELIFNVTGATHTLFPRMDGTTRGSRSDSGGGAATTIQFVDLMNGAGDNSTFRFGHMLFGDATSDTDWFGQPANKQILYPDADVATNGWTVAPLNTKLKDADDATMISVTV